LWKFAQTASESAKNDRPGVLRDFGIKKDIRLAKKIGKNLGAPLGANTPLLCVGGGKAGDVSLRTKESRKKRWRVNLSQERDTPQKKGLVIRRTVSNLLEPNFTINCRRGKKSNLWGGGTCAKSRNP